MCAIATPLALRFFNRPVLEAQTGYPVRSEYKQPGTPDLQPPADAMAVGGASFNTINKWAAGGLPLAALPFLNKAQAAHPAFGHSVKVLREAGVTILLGPGGYEPRRGKRHTWTELAMIHPPAAGCFETVRLTVPPSAGTLGRRRELDGTDAPRMGNVGGVEFTD